MNILLKKVRVKTLFSRFEPIKVEPLELCYLKSLCDQMGHYSYILDELFDTQDIRQPKVNLRRKELLSHSKNLGFIPDIIILTGYNVAENQIIDEAKAFKSIYPDAKIIVGGLHIQLNASSFHKPYVDYVVHSQRLKVLANIIQIIVEEKSMKPLNQAKGFDYRRGSEWIIGSRDVIDSKEDIYPDREFFYKNKNNFHYLDKRSVALVKGSSGCPYKCSYCYCRELNGGRYIRADYSKMIREMQEIDSEYFWIVDDVLFVSGQDVNDFMVQAKKHDFQKKFIAYLRADFIIKEEDKLDLLKKAGLNEVIIGFEAITQKELIDYNKGADPLDYPRVISILKDKGIDYTALFMVQAQYGIKDFVKLYRFIKDNEIGTFTLSVFTPIKGTKGYGDHNLLTSKPEKFDFLHLVTKSKLPKPLFYLLFYGIHLRMLKSKRIWNYLLRRKNENMGFLG